ncbi:MAG TPA: hypothetical protein V6D50_20080 [Chroococcales cyanobacterium]
MRSPHYFPPNHLRIRRDPVENNVSFLDDLELAHRSDWNTKLEQQSGDRSI